MQPVPYLDLVARNVRVARAAVTPKLSQNDVAERMRDLGFKEWRRQTVGNTESGKRRLSVEEALALMVVFNVDMTVLLYPPGDNQPIALPGGQEVLLPPSRYGASIFHHAGGPWTQVWEGNKCLLPRGAGKNDTIHTKEEELQPVAAAIVTSRLGVLVGRRQDGKPPWTFIAGEIEPGEDAPFAAGREVKEETGLEVEPGEEIGRRVHPKTGRTMIYVAAKPTRPGDLDVFVGDERELAEVRWVRLAEADELLPGMFEPVREHLVRTIGEGR